MLGFEGVDQCHLVGEARHLGQQHWPQEVVFGLVVDDQELLELLPSEGDPKPGPGAPVSAAGDPGDPLEVPAQGGVKVEHHAHVKLGTHRGLLRQAAGPSSGTKTSLVLLNVQAGQTLRELCAGLDMARQSVSKHLAALEAANLVTTVWRGREKLHYLNAEPINAIADRWISQYDRARVRALADLKTALEESQMDNPSFVYATYISTTPELLWKGLTEPAFTQRYWETSFITDWAKGSPMTWDNHGVLVSDPEQVVIESDPYRRLSYTWHSFTPELAERFGWNADLLAKITGEPRSRVTFEIEPTSDAVVKLTVVHDGFGPGSTVAEMVSGGWPAVVASLKTLLETGAPLPVPA